MKIAIYILTVCNAFFVSALPIMKILSFSMNENKVIVLRQSAILTMLGWGIDAVMLTALIMRLAKPASWSNANVPVYLTAALTLFGSLLALRGLVLRVSIERKGLKVRTVLRRERFYDYKDLELSCRFSHQLVDISTRSSHLCTLTAKTRGISTMIRKWHDATQVDGSYGTQRDGSSVLTQQED